MMLFNMIKNFVFLKSIYNVCLSSIMINMKTIYRVAFDSEFESCFNSVYFVWCCRHYYNCGIYDTVSVYFVQSKFSHCYHVFFVCRGVPHSVFCLSSSTLLDANRSLFYRAVNYFNSIYTRFELYY